ncbi:MAG: hypothetical protein AAF587_04350 [Bacteroidota bacterium]
MIIGHQWGYFKVEDTFLIEKKANQLFVHMRSSQIDTNRDTILSCKENKELDKYIRKMTRPKPGAFLKGQSKQQDFERDTLYYVVGYPESIWELKTILLDQ